ncbi:MAG: response regulator [Elusimicrobia bacterium CG08_land_8_20_14_0_20_51_18]|nr:MAG: response regulator [Elusimicrobia bacterium CG08_land_8_20_14_0_20_51_18]
MAKIMVVDDDPEISSLVEYTLESLGHKMKVCDNGRDVIDALREFKPDLLVLDVMLPGVDGYSLATKITEEAEFANMPIIVLSALEPSRTMFTKFTQVSAFLTKPFNTDDLVESVKNALAAKPQ